MKAKINEGCAGCGVCEVSCPDVFRMGSDGLAEVYGDVTPDNLDAAKEAAESCPVSVIEIDEA